MENINENKELNNKENNKEAIATTTTTEIKRINLTELVKLYKQRTSIKLKSEFLKSQVKVVNYLGYGTKMFLADQIVKNSCLNGNDVHIDSCKRYILYIYTLVKYYTNLDIKEEDLLMQYDLLNENGLIEEILNLIPEKEIVEFKTILEMKQNDLMTNKYETHAFIKNELNKLYPEVSKVLMPVVDKFGNALDNLDEKKIEETLNKVIKFVM